jgi:hypothetical protein
MVDFLFIQSGFHSQEGSSVSTHKALAKIANLSLMALK